MPYPDFALARPGERWAIDAAHLHGAPIMTEEQAAEARKNPAAVTLDISGETWPQREAKEGRALELVSYAELHKRQEDHYKRPPVLVTADRFMDMLEVLPPSRWDHGTPGRQAFHVCELLSGDLAAWFVKLGRGEAAEYWEIVASCRTSHADIYATAEQASAAHKAAQQVEG